MRAISGVFMVPLAVLAAALAVSVSAQDAPTSVQAGVFSDEQAARGEAIFSEACLVCHQPEEFVEGDYMEGWSGQTVSDMVEFIRSTMPEDNPGRLKRDQYVDVVAFFFKNNGLPTGDSDMERSTLGQIVIEGPYGEE